MADLILADDSETIQRIVELSLGGEDIEIHTFSDGSSVLEYLRTGPVDLILADVGLPEIDGYELCRKVKQNPATSQVPVILLTGALERFDTWRAVEAGYATNLMKPLGTSELVDVVKRFLDLERSALGGDAEAGSNGTLFELSLSQCSPTPHLFARELSPSLESFPWPEIGPVFAEEAPPDAPLELEEEPISEQPSPPEPASLTEDEMNELLQEFVIRVHEELDRILPEAARDAIKRKR